MKSEYVYSGTFTPGPGNLNLISTEPQMTEERWLLEGEISLSLKNDILFSNAGYSKATMRRQARSYFATQTTRSRVKRPVLSDRTKTDSVGHTPDYV
jgi:hypothetical protein